MRICVHAHSYVRACVLCVRAYVRACVCACVCACVRVRVRVHAFEHGGTRECAWYVCEHDSTCASKGERERAKHTLNFSSKLERPDL
jgi:hypothetical protein